MKLLLFIILSFIAKGDPCSDAVDLTLVADKESVCQDAGCCCPSNECSECSTCESEEPSTTQSGPSGECENNDVSDYYLEPIGQSTQFRIYDPCDKKFIKIKMEDLTEYDVDGKKTNNKEVSFASAKGWEWGESSGEVSNDCGGLGGACLYNAFVADQLTKVDAELVLETLFAVDDLIVILEDENGDEYNITVTQGSVKMNVEINNWPYLDSENNLVLCMGIMTNKVGAMKVEDDGRVFRMDTAEIENVKTAQCSGSEDINVEIEIESNNNNQLDICYTFDPCGGNITYDPIFAILHGKANRVSVFLLFAAVAMSLLYV